VEGSKQPMTGQRRGSHPIKFTLRFYPGQDDDLIRWLDGLDGEPIGAKTQAMKMALRRGTDAGQVEAVQGTGTAPVLDLVEVRQVVEAAVASALGRFEGQLAGSAASAAVEEDDEVEDLMHAFEESLVLGDD
jgi:hypothetical protein